MRAGLLVNAGLWLAIAAIGFVAGWLGILGLIAIGIVVWGAARWRAFLAAQRRRGVPGLRRG